MNLNNKPKTKSGRGSVGKSLRYFERLKDPEYAKKIKELSKIKSINHKINHNKRCIDCNKLITYLSTRCIVCSNKRNGCVAQR